MFIFQVKKDLRHRRLQDEVEIRNTSRKTDNNTGENTLQEQARKQDSQSVIN